MERRMVREGLSYLLKEEGEVEITGAVATLEEVPDRKSPGCDVILIDLDDAATADPMFRERVGARFGEVTVVAIASQLDGEMRARFESVGAAGFSLKTSPSAELIELVHGAA